MEQRRNYLGLNLLIIVGALVFIAMVSAGTSGYLSLGALMVGLVLTAFLILNRKRIFRQVVVSDENPNNDESEARETVSKNNTMETSSTEKPTLQQRLFSYLSEIKTGIEFEKAKKITMSSTYLIMGVCCTIVSITIMTYFLIDYQHESKSLESDLSDKQELSERKANEYAHEQRKLYQQNIALSNIDSLNPINRATYATQKSSRDDQSDLVEKLQRQLTKLNSEIRRLENKLNVVKITNQNGVNDILSRHLPRITIVILLEIMTVYFLRLHRSADRENTECHNGLVKVEKNKLGIDFFLENQNGLSDELKSFIIKDIVNWKVADGKLFDEEDKLVDADLERLSKLSEVFSKIRGK